jgi:23S rRNA pseudouridine2605 synthase
MGRAGHVARKPPRQTYHVQIAALPDEVLLEKIRKGIRAEDGDLLRAKSAEILRDGEKNSWLVVVLDEGKNRHIRRIFESLRIEVLRLIRVAIGPLALGDLQKGKSRPLTPAEKRILDAAMAH